MVMVLFILCALASAQEFKVFDRRVQVHGFASQGFAYTDHNNWLSMNTSHGSWAMTEGAVNVSSQITDKFRIAGQAYSRNIGNLGQGHLQLDWAVADYRFAEWLGVRAGRVKTTIGLYNDTQDMNFLHTWAILPQAVYSQDMRDGFLSHNGGDVYGTIRLKKAGSLDYTGYTGYRKDGVNGGYPYLLRKGAKIFLTDFHGYQWGADLRWHTPIKGVLLGASGLRENTTGTGTNTLLGGGYTQKTKKDYLYQYYGQYSVGKFRFDGEYRRQYMDATIFSGRYEIWSDARGWYTSGAYRVHPKVELGAYFSRFTINAISTVPLAVGRPQQSKDESAPDRHINDKVISGRVDINRYFDVKVEGHFMDGYGSWRYPSGFYEGDNVSNGGLQPGTKMLVIKAGFHF
jgi:hypothetical protein